MELDTAVVLWLNRFARASWSLDHLVVLVSETDLFKGGALAALVWGLWFREHEDREARQERLLVTLVASVIAIAVGRGMALLLPFRARPVHDPDVAFVLPYGARRGMLESWSAFPSDHAVLFFALVVGIGFVSRRAGWVAAAYVLLVIVLPRIYLGLHYPTDVLAGAGVGVAIALLAHTTTPRHWVVGHAWRWRRASPVTFYACLFLLSFQVAVLFEDLRDVGDLLLELADARLGGP